MTQANPLIGAGKTGIEYRTQDNEGKKALLTQHKGGLPPSYAEAGVLWLDDSATPWMLKLHDGADWITLMSINAASNTVMPYLGGSALGVLPYAPDTGSVNAYAVAPIPPIANYTIGQLVLLKPMQTNTGAATISVSGRPATPIVMPNGSGVPAGALLASGVFLLFYNGGQFIVMNPATALSIADGIYWACDERPAGSVPSIAVFDNWATRSLNSEKKNTINGAFLASNALSLPPGTYEVDAFAVMHNANGSTVASSAIRLRDTTHGVTLAMGSGQSLAPNGSCVAKVQGVFTLTSTAIIQLQYYCHGTGSVNLGFTTDNGDKECWANVVVNKRGS